MNNKINNGKKFVSDNSIQQQLFKVIRRTLLLSMLILGGLFSVFNIWNTLTQLTQNAKEIVHGTSLQLTTPVLFKDKYVTNDILRELKERQAIMDAEIYYLKTPVSIHANKLFLCPQLNWYSQYFVQCEAIHDEEIIEAYLAVTFSRELVLLTLAVEVVIFMVILLFSYWLALFYAKRLSEQLTAPLRELSDISERVINDDDFSIRANVNTYAEVAALSRVMNQMFAEIESRNNQTREYAEELEDKVLERTESLQLAIKQAIEANLAKSEFLANMSHELRTPLHGILSFSQFGLKRYTTASPEKLAEYFTHIKTSGERLLILLDDLLDLAKFESGKMDINKASHNLKHIAENCIIEQQARLEEKQLTLRWDENTQHTTANFDATKLTQVIVNLLSNAIKFSSAHSTITLQITAATLYKEPALKFSLSDKGIGIPDSELQSVFNKFIQSSKTKTSAGGTGLGLAICREIIEYHDGKIWAESPQTGGAIFSFIIPTL